MKRTIYMTFAILFFCELSFSQQVKRIEESGILGKHTLKGIVVFQETGEPAVGAQVFLDSIYIGAATGFDGGFTLKNVPAGEYSLKVYYVGFEPHSIRISIPTVRVIQIELIALPINLESVSVVADRLIDKASVSDISFISSQIESFKGLQEDPVNILTLLPGITKGSNDLFSATQLYVRGGAPDENLFLYDNVKIYWPWYMGGIKSVFNNEVIDKVELLTGGFIAKYGNAMSSVVRVTTREGDFSNYGGNFTFGFSSMQGMLEGPIVKDRASAFLSVRKTYLDLFMGENAEFPVPNLLDGTFKIAFKVSPLHSITLSGMSSREKMNFYAKDREPGMPDKIYTMNINHNQSLQLRSLLTEKFYNNLSLYRSFAGNDFFVGSNLNMEIHGSDIGLRNDATYSFRPNNTLSFGVEASSSNLSNKGRVPLNPSELNMGDTTVVLRAFDYSSKANYAALYLSHSWEIFSRISLLAGLRGDWLFYEKYAPIMDISPRFSTKVRVLSKTHVRASYGLFHQSPHFEALDNNNQIQSNRCEHYIIGLEQIIGANFKGWVELYRKNYSNLVVYNLVNQDSHDISFSNDGKGYSSGAELFLMYKKHPLTCWLSYSYSISKRKQSMHDRVYFFEYDKPHMVNFAAEYIVHQNKSWYIPHIVSTQFRCESGNPYTPIIGAISTTEGWLPISGEINSLRNPPFHSLSIRVEWLAENTERIRVKSFFEIWNIYNHRNILGRYYDYGAQHPDNFKENIYYSTPIMPSGGFRIEF
jgi:hypothetical protein